MVNAERAFQILVDEITGEIKELIEPIMQQIIAEGGLSFLTEVSAEELLSIASGSGAKIVNNAVIEIMRLAIQQGVHKVFVKNFGRPPKVKKGNELEMRIANAVLQKVSAMLLAPMNEAAGAAIGGAITANPIFAPLGVAVGRLAGMMATAFEESMFHELLLYKGHFISKLAQPFKDLVEATGKLGSKESNRTFLENLERERGKLRKDFNEIGRFFKGKHKRHHKKEVEPTVLTPSNIRPMEPGKVVDNGKPSVAPSQPTPEQPEPPKPAPEPPVAPPSQPTPAEPPKPVSVSWVETGPLLTGVLEDDNEDGDLINISFFP